LWFSGLCRIDWSNSTLLDLGSELSPMPWFLAFLGAKTTLVESNEQWIPQWKWIRKETGIPMDWRIVPSEQLLFLNDTFDVVTSFSVIEHQRDKKTAVNEAARVLKPGGLFAVSFDICEPSMGMTFPEWNGKALTMREFETLIWDHPLFSHKNTSPRWNVEDTQEFITWHLKSAPHHNYVVGAALLRKTPLPHARPQFRFDRGWYSEERAAGEWWHWSNKEGQIDIYCVRDMEVEIHFELFSLPPKNNVDVFLNGRPIFRYDINWQGFRPANPLIINLPGGSHTLLFKSQREAVILSTDPRPLAFSVKNFSLRPAMK